MPCTLHTPTGLPVAITTRIAVLLYFLLRAQRHVSAEQHGHVVALHMVSVVAIKTLASAKTDMDSLGGPDGQLFVDWTGPGRLQGPIAMFKRRKCQSCSTDLTTTMKGRSWPHHQIHIGLAQADHQGHGLELIQHIPSDWAMLDHPRRI